MNGQNQWVDDIIAGGYGSGQPELPSYATTATQSHPVPAHVMSEMIARKRQFCVVDVIRKHAQTGMVGGNSGCDEA